VELERADMEGKKLKQRHLLYICMEQYTGMATRTLNNYRKRLEGSRRCDERQGHIAKPQRVQEKESVRKRM